MKNGVSGMDGVLRPPILRWRRGGPGKGVVGGKKKKKKKKKKEAKKKKRKEKKETRK